MRHDRVVPWIAGRFLFTWRSQIALVAVAWLTALGQAASAAELEPLPARTRQLRESLPPDVELADEDDLTGIATLVEKLYGPQGLCVGEAGGVGWLSGLFKSGSRAKDLTPHFDVERMFGQLESSAAKWPGGLAAHRPQVEQTFFARAAQLPLLMNISSCQVRRLHLHSDTGEAELYTSQRQSDGEIAYGHFWLAKRDGAWRIYELEATQVGIRQVASHIAESSLRGEARKQRTEAERKLLLAREYLDVGLDDFAQEWLAPFETITFDSELEAMRWIDKCKQSTVARDLDGALGHLAKAEALRPGAAFVKYERALCFLKRDKHAEALDLLRQHQDLAGGNAEVFGDVGRALFALKDIPGAVTAYRQALWENPTAHENLIEILKIRPNLEPAELDEYLAMLRLRQENFEELAHHFNSKHMYQALERLIARHRVVAPKSSLSDYYQAQMLSSRHQHEQAAELYKAGMNKHSDNPEFQNGYLSCMLELNRGLDGYREAKNPKDAFLYLAGNSDDTHNYRRGLLAKLLVAHRERFPEDPALLYYEARLKTLNKDYQGAAELMRQGMKIPSFRFRWKTEYAELMKLAGKPVDEQETAAENDERFERQAMHYVQDEEPELLEKLLVAREKSHPSDDRLNAFRARLYLLQDKPEKAVALLRPLLTGKTEHYEQEIFLDAMLACGKPVQAYLESPLRERSFSYLAANLQGDDLEKLLVAARAREPENPDLNYYQALLLIGRHQEAEAVAYLRGAMRNAKEDDVEQLQDLYLSTAKDVYGVVPAYDGAPNPESAFRTLASQCYYGDEFDSLEKLIAAHRKRVPKDQGMIGMFAARTHAHFQRFDQAIAEYNAVIDSDPGFDLTYYCRSELFDLMIKAGKAVEYYEKQTPNQENFNRMASACSDRPDADQLAGLLAVRRKQVSDPAELLDWEVKLLELRHDDEGIVKLLSPPATAAHSDSTDENLVRSLIRLKRFDEAPRVADRLDHNVPYFTAIVAGSRGDTAAAIRDLEECLKYGDYDLDTFGADDLLGPLLNTPPFEEFWKKQKAIEDAENGNE